MNARCLAGGLVLALVGCRSEPRLVRVDVDRLARQELARAAMRGGPEAPLPTPPRGAQPAVLRLPGRPAEMVQDPSRSSQGKAEAQAEAEQRRALASFEAGLRRVDERKVRAYRAQGQILGAVAIRGLSESINHRLQEMFDRYARQRTPKVLELANLVGFPDPNPTSAPPRGKVTPYVQKKLDAAKRVRDELAVIDKMFDKEKGDLLATLEGAKARDRADIDAKVVAYRGELDREANRLAETEVGTSARALGLRLIEPTPVVLATVPARTILLPGEPPSPPPPQVPSEQIARGLPERRQEIVRELTIWAAVRGYQLSSRGRDATQEFQSWRETYRAGL